MPVITFVLNILGFPALSSHCLLVDVDIHYDAFQIGNNNFDEMTKNFKNSLFTKSTTDSWHGQLEQSCGQVNVLFDYISYKRKTNSRDLILAVTFLYEFKNGAEVRPSDEKLKRCINATREKHDEHIKKYNWLSSIPTLNGRNGQKVKPHAALYDMNIRHCCAEKNNLTCCPEGAMTTPGGESSYCGEYKKER